MFLHPYLLAGLGACAVPVLLHLLNRQQPKRLVFPAFRFLLQRQNTNQRRMRFRNILLMLLRVLALAALVFALARPLLFAGAQDGPGKDVTAVLLVDTSPSMEYAVAGVSRLDAARERAAELLDLIGPKSEVAVLDSGALMDLPFDSVGKARDDVGRLTIKPGAGSLNRAFERGFDLLERRRKPGEGQSLVLYAITDRAAGCWDARDAIPTVPEGVAVRIIDVGTKSPRDLGVEAVELVPPVVVAGGAFQARVRLRGTRTGHKVEQVTCQVEGGEPCAPQPVNMDEGQDYDEVVFEMKAPNPREDSDHPTPCAVTVQLAPRDNMPFNDVRHATLLVGGMRPMLTLVSRRGEGFWSDVQAEAKKFRNEEMTFAEADRRAPRDDQLARYSVITLNQVDAVPDVWWARLERYVRDGGNLAIIPPKSPMHALNENGKALLPAPLTKLVDAPRGVGWGKFTDAHALTKQFARLLAKEDADFGRNELRPLVRRYWGLGPLAEGAREIIPYAAPGAPPALAERQVGKGRVLLYSTPLDAVWIEDREDRKKRGPEWTNYWTSSFGFCLVEYPSRYLAGEAAVPEVNFVCGREVNLRLPASLSPPFTLSGPGLTAGEMSVAARPAGGELKLPQARQPGTYLLKAEGGQAVAGFSLNVPGREGLLDPAKELEQVFGEGAVVEAGEGALRDALVGGRSSPLELLPWLMMALLALMAAEGALANRYYESPPASAGAEPPTRPTPAPSTSREPEAVQS